MSKLKDGVDKCETAWHLSMVFRERQPVALPLSKFLRVVTWRRRGATDKRGGTDQAGGRDEGSSRDESSGSDESNGRDKGNGMDEGSGTDKRMTQTWGRHR